MVDLNLGKTVNELSQPQVAGGHGVPPINLFTILDLQCILLFFIYLENVRWPQRSIVIVF